jgi:predicted SAM-dependent methyltransferase
LDQYLTAYLRGQGPHKLEIGTRETKPGWLTSDLVAQPGAAGVPVIALDATKEFPIPSDSFDFVYTEHMIEHIGFEDGLSMLGECNRVLKPGGVIRVVTPSLGFIYRVTSSDRSPLEDRYREWSVRTFVPGAPAVTNALFLNNFVRGWGHTFIYDHDTLRHAMQLAGFVRVTACDLNASDHPPLRNLENERRLPAGFLALESLVIEAEKGAHRSPDSTTWRNLALGKRATQSSVSPWSRQDTPEKDASRVVSGNFTGAYNNHTGLDDPAWWRVDLGRVYDIRKVQIYNRTDQQHIMCRTNRFEIQISNDDSAWIAVFRKETAAPLSGSKYLPFVWAPPEAVQARFVRIQLMGKQYLHLDQVEIFGDG